MILTLHNLNYVRFNHFLQINQIKMKILFSKDIGDKLDENMRLNQNLTKILILFNLILYLPFCIACLYIWSNYLNIIIFIFKLMISSDFFIRTDITI